MNLNSIPNEVLWVLTLPKMVGSDTYNEAERIINKYPKYFPWEHKYKAVPKEVHEAYRREKYPDWDKPIVCSGEGLCAQIKASEVKEINYDLDIKKFFNDLEDTYKKEQEDKIKDKALWDKHYSKYNLEYKEL